MSNSLWCTLLKTFAQGTLVEYNIKRKTRKKRSTLTSLTSGLFFFKWTFTRNRNPIQPCDLQTAFSFQLTLLNLSVFLFCVCLFLPSVPDFTWPYMLGWCIRHLLFFYLQADNHLYYCLFTPLFSPSTYTISRKLNSKTSSKIFIP